MRTLGLLLVPLVVLLGVEECQAFLSSFPRRTTPTPAATFARPSSLMTLAAKKKKKNKKKMEDSEPSTTSSSSSSDDDHDDDDAKPVSKVPPKEEVDDDETTTAVAASATKEHDDETLEEKVEAKIEEALQESLEDAMESEMEDDDTATADENEESSPPPSTTTPPTAVVSPSSSPPPPPADKTTTPTPTTTKTTTTKAPSTQENLLFLQSLGAITGRGEFATYQQHSSAQTVVTALEKKKSQSSSSSNLQGRWELVYTNTQLFRSSPFFMAGRAACNYTNNPKDDARKFNWFCDMHRKALAISNIQAVRQIITGTGRLVSEVEVSVGAVPFLSDFTPFVYSGGAPLTITGALVSSADVTTTMSSGSSSSLPSLDMELYMDTVEIKGSNIPGLRQVLDLEGVQLASRELAQTLERAIASYETPRPIFRTTYLDERFRISRDEDENIFCYIKTSDDDSLTDYSDVDSDLGLGKLVKGFQSAILGLED